MDPRALRRTFLWLFLGCLGLTALLAIVTVLGGEFGHFQARVLGSSAAISAASVCAMACAAFRERERRPQLGTAGIALAGIALAAVLLVTWSDNAGDGLVKTAVLLAMYAAATAHAELLLLPALATRHLWVQRTAVGAIAVLSLLLTVQILGELRDDAMPRLIAVVSILVALLTLAVPILWKLGRDTAAGPAPARRQLLLRENEDGTWIDANGARYTLQRLDAPDAGVHA